MTNLQNENWCQKYAIMMEEHLNLIKENQQLKNDVNSLKGNIRAIQKRNDELTKKPDVMHFEMKVNENTSFDEFLSEAKRYAEHVIKYS